MKKVIFSAALFMGLASVSLAGTPAAPTASNINSGATVKWFHFNGDASNPSDLSDASKYTPAASNTPTCPDNSQAYRCDIEIMSQQSNQDLPDLSQPVIQERTRDNAQ